MGVLSSTSTMRMTSPLPAHVTAAMCVAALHDHDLYIQADPHLSKYHAVPETSPARTTESYKLPRDVRPLPGRCVRVYEVTDIVPNPVMSSTVVSTEELVDMENGLWVRIRAAMGTVMETSWTVEARADGQGCELVEAMTISCSRLLMGVVKGGVEASWKKIHDKIIASCAADAAQPEL